MFPYQRFAEWKRAPDLLLRFQTTSERCAQPLRRPASSSSLKTVVALA
jgi:hypothetical protein